MTYMTDSKTNTNTPSIRSLSAVDLSAVSGGTQVYVHEFGIGSVNMATGLRPFEPKMPASPDPEAGLGAYGSTNNNLPGWSGTSPGAKQKQKLNFFCPTSHLQHPQYQ